MESIPYDKRSGKIWFNGKTVNWADANIHVLNHGLHYASCVFEGERVYDGEIFKLEEHTERLFYSAKRMGIKVPFSQKEINDAVVKQAEADAKSSGFDTTNLFTIATDDKGKIDIVTTDTSELDASVATELADRVMQTPKRTGYDGYLIGDGIAPNGEAFGHGIAFPSGQSEGDFFLRTDMLPNRLFRYDGRRWIKQEDNVRMTMSQTDTKATQKAGFVNNVNTNKIAGETVQERQSLSKALRPKADN